jgi:proteasome lid subunit RPN8/RPN11
MTLQINRPTLDALLAHLENAYPEEGAGFLLGRTENGARRVYALVEVANAREDTARHNRFLITPQDTIRAEEEADRMGLELLGVFHSHPDCPNVPSEFDRQWALPWFSYTITRVDGGAAVSTRSWRLSDDRETYHEERVEIVPGPAN